MPSQPRGPRQRVLLPVALNARFAAHCEANGVNGATLLYGWLVAAARIVRQGHGHTLPKGGRSRRGTVGEVVGVDWSQGGVEYRRCRDLLAQAGTDPTTVLRSSVASYVAVGGDILAMQWPPTEAPGVQANPAVDTAKGVR